MANIFSIIFRHSLLYPKIYGENSNEPLPIFAIPAIIFHYLLFFPKIDGENGNEPHIYKMACSIEHIFDIVVLQFRVDRKID